VFYFVIKNALSRKLSHTDAECATFARKDIHEKGNTREKAKNKTSKYNDQTNR
jgi:hypothetical protein